MPDRVASSTLGRWLIYCSIAVGGCALDLATKSWIFGRLGMPGGGYIPVVGEILVLETSLNEGALFGMGQGGGWLFVALGIVALTGILSWLAFGGGIHDRWLTVALASVSAGICGNLYDRLGLPGLLWNYPPDRIGQPVHAVRDWIHFEVKSIGFDFPVFNIADSLLVVGVTFLLWQTFRAEARRTQPTTSPSS